jgi:hypothetical protein
MYALRHWSTIANRSGIDYYQTIHRMEKKYFCLQNLYWATI